MDIGSILAAADNEVDYDQEQFEAFHAESAGDEHHGAGQDGSEAGGAGSPKKSVTEVLQSAAKAIVKEEKEEARQILTDTAVSVKEEISQATRNILASGAPAKDDAMGILLAAGAEVARLNDGTASGGAAVAFKDDRDDPETEDDDEEEGSYNDNEELNKELIFSAHQGKTERIRALLEKENVNVLHRDRHGWTAMHWAASKGYADILEVLFAHRRRSGKKMSKVINAPDRLAGWTPLHVAAVCCQVEVVKLLALDYQVSLKKRDLLGEIPFDVVGKGKYHRTIRRILNPNRDAEDEDGGGDDDADDGNGERTKARDREAWRDRR